MASCQKHSTLTLSDENNNLEQIALRSRKNYRKKSTDYLRCRITHTTHVLCQNQQITRE